MFKSYYLIEIRTVNGTTDLFQHYLCTARGRAELTDIIRNLDPEAQWQVTNVIKLTKNDYLALQTFFDAGDNNAKEKANN